MKKRPVRRGSHLVPLAALVAAATMLLGGLPPATTPFRTAGPNQEAQLASTLSSFTLYRPGELWAGANPGEKCLDCTVDGLLSRDAARSLAKGADVVPETGDFHTSLALVSIPAKNGTLTLTLSYDAERSIAQSKQGTTSTFNPGLFGYGWHSVFSDSMIQTGQTFKVTEPDGSQLFFTEIGTTPADLQRDGCPKGSYGDWQKFTVATSTAAFCAAARVSSQIGTGLATGGRELYLDGGTQVQIFNRYGSLTAIGTLHTKLAIRTAETVAPGTSPDTGKVLCTASSGQTCDLMWTTTASTTRSVRAYLSTSGTHQVEFLVDPMTRRFTLTFTADANLTAVKDPAGDVTAFSYTTSNATTHDRHLLTKMIDPNHYGLTPPVYAKQITYKTGMVKSLTVGGALTTYKYVYNNCATTTGCILKTASQYATITYADGGHNTDRFLAGLLTFNCYGTKTSTFNCGSHAATWLFSYSFPSVLGQRFGRNLVDPGISCSPVCFPHRSCDDGRRHGSERPAEGPVGAEHGRAAHARAPGQ